jgi:CBS domain-containing protein
MGISEKIKDIMIPIEDTATVSVDAPLKDVIPALKKLYCQVEEGKCSEAGFRAVMVLDENRQVVGIADFQCLMEVLIPEITGSFPAKLHALWDDLGTVSRFHFVEDPEHVLRTRIMENAKKQVGEVMRRIEAAIMIDVDVLEALMILYQSKCSMLPVYDGEHLVGVVRDSDLFLAIAAMLHEPDQP